MTELERAKQEIVDGRVEIELDVSAPPNSGSFTIAAETARDRLRSLQHGQARVAYVYDKMKRQRDPRARHSRSFSVTDEECTELVKLGAKWIGPDFYRPYGVKQ